MLLKPPTPTPTLTLTLTLTSARRRPMLLGGMLALAALLGACGSPPPADGGADGSVVFDVVNPDVTIDTPADVAVDRVVPTDVPADMQCPSGMLCSGTCVETLTDVHHCGACATDCTTAAGTDPALARCDLGRCVIGCRPGQLDCDGNPANGCEATNSSAANCGGCGNACAGATPMCSMGVGPTGGYGCSNGCSAPTPNRCGTTCTDLLTDANNCGMCGLVCAAPTGGMGACRAGACTQSCGSGTHLCSGACVSNMAVATCGMGCSPCTAPANATATCNGTTCGFTCNTGFHACGAVCVSNSAVTTCGAACAPCVAPANATSTCDGTGCGFTCNPGFADCDRVASNGCEADLRTSAHCGSCTTVCTGANPFCDGSGATPVCANGCSAPGALCAGVCVNTQTDPQNCGSCGRACPVPANGRATCAANTCGFTCTTGYHACGNACVANDSPASCGTSCTPCVPPAGATATCDGTTCGIDCPAGQHSCSNTCVTDLDLAHCGLSCTPCPTDPNGATSCNGAACVLVCNPGYTQRGNACVDIDECALTSAICGPGICANTPGSYTCNCPTGYRAPATGGTCVPNTIVSYTASTPTLPFLNACTAPTHDTLTFPDGKGGSETDDGITSVTPPFAFNFYDRVFSTINVSTNGNLQFVSATTAYSNECLPSGTLNYAIAALWDDLVADNAVCTATFGTPGSRQFVVTWDGAYYPGGSGHVLFSAVLHEDTLAIDVLYSDLTGSQSATVGVQRDTGSASTEFLCSSSGGGSGGKVGTLGGVSAVTAPSSVRFTPVFGGTR